jgi:hypothetical protein
LICIYQRLDHINGDTSNATPFLKKKRMESKVNTPAIIMVTGAVSNYLVAVKPLKWLYLSMLHPETPEVMKLLSNALGNTQKYFTCIKFLPRNMQTPTFISFKVGMSEDLFEKILDPAVWFYRVAIMEFVSWPRKFLRPSVVRIFLQTRKLNMDKDREVDATLLRMIQWWRLRTIFLTMVLIRTETHCLVLPLLTFTLRFIFRM